MIISKVKSIIKEKAMRLIQVLVFGDKDIREADQLSPSGIDSSPIKDMIAIYSDTTINGEPVIIGYIQKNQLAEPGEVRIYSQNNDGSELNYMWLKSSGDIEIGGDSDHFVKHSKLNTSLQNYNNLIKAELTKIQAAITTLGGAYVKLDPTINISDSKTDKIKTE